MDYLDEETLNKIEKEIGITRSKVKDDLDIMRNWVNRQPHLPVLEDNDDTNDWLYRILFYSKNRIERAKRQLETYFSCKSLMPEFYGSRDPEEEGIKSNVRALYLATLPKLTPEGYRIHVFCHAMPDPNAYEPKDFMRRALMMCDWKIKNDLTAGDIIIMHMKNSTLAHWRRYNLHNLSRFVAALTNAYQFRIKSVYFIEAPYFVCHIVNNPFMPAKLKKRVKIYPGRDFEAYLKDIPKDCLPPELGGTMNTTLNELNESTYGNLREMKAWFLDNENVKSDESKRTGELSENSLFGCHGTFRNLQLD